MDTFQSEFRCGAVKRPQEDRLKEILSSYQNKAPQRSQWPHWYDRRTNVRGWSLGGGI